MENENEVPLELQTHAKKETVETDEVPLELQTHGKESKESKSKVTSPMQYPEVKRAFDVAGGVAGAATSAGLMAPSAAYKKGLDLLNLMGMDPSYVPGGLHRYVNSQIDPIATGLSNAEIRPKDLKTATGVPFLRTGKEAQEAIKIAQGLPAQMNPIFMNTPQGTAVNLSQLTGHYHHIPGTQPIDLSPYAISKNVVGGNPKLDMLTNATRSTLGRGFLGGYNAVDALQQDNPLQTGIATIGTVGSLMPYIEKPLPTSFRQKVLPKQIGAFASLGAPIINLILDQFKSDPDKDIGVLTKKAEGGLAHLANGGVVGYSDGRSVGNYRQEHTAQAYEPSYSEQIRDWSTKFLSPEQADAIFGGPRAQTIDKINPISVLAQTPGVIADSAKGFMESAKQGNYPSAMLNYGVGLLNAAPFVKPAAKVANATGKTVLKELGPKFGEMSEDFLHSVGAIHPITAWHGTPHKIEGGFDLAKVGTGEGNQTFGHGMYFGQERKTGEEYQRRLSEKLNKNTVVYKGDDGYYVKNGLGSEGKNIAGPFKKSDEAETIRKGLETKGNLYKVDIPDEQIPKMLDLDKPISEQMHVWEALHPDVRKAIDDLMETKFRNPISEVPEAYTGQNLYGALSHHDVGEVLPPELPNSNWFKGDTSYEKHASQYLNSLGIPGIKYLDQGSRGNAPIVRKVNVLNPETNTYTKEQYEVDPRWHEPNKKYYFPTEEEAKTHADSYGTRNFVSFDPATVKILEENDVPKFAKGGPTENSNNQSASQMAQKQFSVQGIPLKPSDDESYQSWWTDASKQNDMNRYANAMLPSKDLNISNPSYLKGVESITNYPGGHITGQLGFYKPFIDGSNINVTSDLNEKEAPYVTGHEAQHLQDNLAFFNQWGDEKNYSFLNRLDRGAAKTNSKPYEEQIEKNYQDYVKKWKKEEDENPNKSYYGSSRFRANEELGNYYDRTPGFDERFADFAGLEAALPRGARLADTPLGKAVFNTPELQNYYNLNTRPLEIKAMPGNSPTSPTADALRKIKAELKLHFGNSNESYVDALINTIKHSLK